MGIIILIKTIKKASNKRIAKKNINRIAQGYSENDLPVKFPAEGISSNEFVKVVLTALEKGDDPFLTGKRVIKLS
jgi:hypothetical protein